MVVIAGHPLIQVAIQALVEPQPDMELVGSAATEAEGLKLIAAQQPDVALVDLELPGGSGLDVVRQGGAQAPDCRFLILAAGRERATFRRVLRERVGGVILKEALPEEYVGAIRLVARGRMYMDPSVVRLLITEDDDPLRCLTGREREVLMAMAGGLSNRDIAARLLISEYTLKKHVSQILDKLAVGDRTQAVLYAVAHGFSPVTTSTKPN